METRFQRQKSVTVISVCVCKLQVSALAVLRGERFDEEQSLLSTIIDQQKESPLTLQRIGASRFSETHCVENKLRQCVCTSFPSRTRLLPVACRAQTVKDMCTSTIASSLTVLSYSPTGYKNAWCAFISGPSGRIDRHPSIAVYISRLLYSFCH